MYEIQKLKIRDNNVFNACFTGEFTLCINLLNGAGPRLRASNIELGQ